MDTLTVRTPCAAAGMRTMGRRTEPAEDAEPALRPLRADSAACGAPACPKVAKSAVPDADVDTAGTALTASADWEEGCEEAAEAAEDGASSDWALGEKSSR